MTTVVHVEKGPGIVMTSATTPRLAVRPDAPIAQVVPNVRLDDAVRKVLESDLHTKVHAWRVGSALREIEEGELWKLRVTPEGRQAYRSFEQFAFAECRYSRAYAYGAVDLAKTFTEEQVRQYGAYKLMVVARNPPEVKERLFEMAKNGATVRVLREEVKKDRAERGESYDSGRKGAARTLSGNEGAPRKGGELTVAQTVGESVLPLWADEEMTTPVVAVELPDPETGEVGVYLRLDLRGGPIAVKELTNRVRMIFRYQVGGNMVVSMVAKTERET